MLLDEVGVRRKDPALLHVITCAKPHEASNNRRRPPASCLKQSWNDEIGFWRGKLLEPLHLHELEDPSHS